MSRRPTPDGRLFVTPARNRGGLEFYDADEVWREARAGRGPEVEPIFTDYQMRDQYPSVGILEESGDGTAVTYRVLTSWYDKVAFRDYRVTYSGEGGIDVRPTRRPVRACPEGQVSLPIMSQDGRVLSARDENAGTTKLFDLADDGACTETLDTGMPTGKVAFDSEGDRIAFSIPRGVIGDGTGRPTRARRGGPARSSPASSSWTSTRWCSPSWPGAATPTASPFPSSARTAWPAWAASSS